MAAQNSATLPATFAKDSGGTTPRAVDTITEFTSGAGVTVDKLLKPTAGISATGNIAATGDVTAVNGTFSGTVTAAGVTAVTPIAAVTADGAITIAAQNKIYMITKAGVAAMTIADPTATTHDGVVLVFVAATANAHTLSNAAGSGFFSSGGASKDVATFGGAIGDGLAIIAYQGKWYIDPRGVTNITLG